MQWLYEFYNISNGIDQFPLFPVPKFRPQSCAHRIALSRWRKRDPFTVLAAAVLGLKTQLMDFKLPGPRISSARRAKCNAKLLQQQMEVRPRRFMDSPAEFR
jgi:hypothetical protein